MSAIDQAEKIIGQSDCFLSVMEHTSQLAALNKPVLIIGERGTGKELIAARLHYLSPRWDSNYLSLNCAALNENLLESELFGHESGAFTGASKRHMGRFERANNGSLFLDELANTPPLVQEKLLRVIEYGEFERVGGSQSVRVDVRLIAATNEDLPSLAREGKFRADLLDRLAFDVITLPPLRERGEDILLLAEHFAVSMAKQLQLELFPGFTDEAIHQLLSYRWPGNIRELKNVVERSVYRNAYADQPLERILFDPFDSPYRPGRSMAEMSSPASEQERVKLELPLDLKQHLQDEEQRIIRLALADSQFNQRKTAELLGLSYHQLRGIMKKYGLFEELK